MGQRARFTRLFLVLYRSITLRTTIIRIRNSVFRYRTLPTRKISKGLGRTLVIHLLIGLNDEDRGFAMSVRRGLIDRPIIDMLLFKRKATRIRVGPIGQIE